MNLLNIEISYYDESFRCQIKPTALDFLKQLKGLSIFDIKGLDQTRTRVITTLIHGNEPSGFIACHLWLRSSDVPATNLRIIFCNPEAARTRPIFSNRYLAHSEDLNRYFSVPESDQSEVAIRARKIQQAIKEVNPEAIIDLHNTSGASPAFSVAITEDDRTLDLVCLFTRNHILTGLTVGALMEQSFDAPLATIECGGANEIYSHQVAADGIQAYISRENLFDRSFYNHMAHRVEVHRDPIRVELVGEASVGFSHNRLPTTDITLNSDIEQLNRQKTSAGEFLGWCGENRTLPLQAIDEQGINQIENLIEQKNGCLFAKQSMQLFMVTTILEIATNDCLFYATIE